MGRKSKAQQYGLVELIVSKHDGGKNTVVYVTDEVNRWLEENGLKIKFSREAIRRVIKTHEEEVLAAKESIEAAKAMDLLLPLPGLRKYSRNFPAAESRLLQTWIKPRKK